MKKINITKTMSVSAVIVLAACMFVINYLSPYIADDYISLSHKVWGTGRKISGFGDFCRSIYNFYLNWGGRVEGTVCAAIFSYLPPAVFDLFNTLCYMIVTLLIYLICRGDQTDNLPLYLGIHVLLWVFVPDYGQIMFWMCGSANYLWASVWILLLLYFYRRYTISNGTLFAGRAYSIPAFLLGFLAGAAMENMSAGMLVILTLHIAFYYKYKYKIHLPVLASYLGSLLGFAFLVLAPGNSARSKEEIELSVLFKFFVICYYWAMFIGVIGILWLVLNVIIKAVLPHDDRKAACESLLYMCGAAAAAYCMLAAPSSPERTWYIVCVYALTAAGILYSALLPCQTALIRKAAGLAASGAMVLLLVSMADTMYASYEISVQTKEREAYIMEQKALGNMNLEVPVITHKYPLRAHHDVLTGLSDLTADADFWINEAAADYFGVDSIVGTAGEVR
ncbi:MAG: hypothetical protein HFH30_00375 [Eubacterium sp.]|nr:hypothetical protein [Eubacterium sp.]MCI8917497.1 hypothetical protein [Eubacterium sp.]